MSVACCLHDRWYMKPDKALPELGSPTAAAFRAEDVEDLNRRSFALICDPKLPARMDAIEALQKIASPNLLVPVDVGPLLWTPTKRWCRVLVFPEPPGKRIPAGPNERFTPWAEQEILVSVVAPLLALLMKLDQAGVMHRAIRADNIFVSGQGTQSQITLGECVSAPPGFDQPPAYLTIEDAAADPPGRSGGTLADELYALGVLILHLATGRLPGANLTAEELLATRLERGTHATLTSGQSIPGILAELVRGLLSDRAGERWGIADIGGWLGGKRPVPRTVAARVPRPLEIEGKKFTTLPALVHWLTGADERQVGRALRHVDMEPWLSVAMANNPRALDRFRTALSSSDGGRESASLVARVAVILDPAGPIRYRNISSAIDGVGNQLAAYMQNGATAELKIVSEMVMARLPQFWAANQTQIGNQASQRAFVFERICRFLVDTRPGNGIERTGYELVPDLHCLSPLVERQFVDDLARLLPALEGVIGTGGVADGWPIDRHIAAYIAARSPESIDSQLGSLTHNDLATRWATTTRLMAKLQDRSGPASLPGLCRILAALGSPLIERFHNRPTRKKMKTALAEAVGSGRLKLLVDLLDDEDALKRDQSRFDRARAGYQGTTKGLATCDRAMEDLARRSAQVGAAISVTVSAVLSTGIALVSLLAMGVF